MKWESYTIEELCNKVTSGGTPLRSVSEYYDGGSIPWIKTKEVNFNRIYDADEKITEKGLDNSSAKLIPENSILIAMYGDGHTAGRCAINRLPVTTNQACCNLVINPEKANPDYMFYKISTLYEIFRGLKSGGSQQNLNAKTLREFKLEIPPLPTQRRIASILSADDDLIENNLRRIKLLEEKASLMYKQLSDELSRSEKINLYDFADIQMGYAFKADAFNETGDGTPIIRIRDIPNQITKSYTTQEVDPNYFVEKGDLLIGMDGEFHMNEWFGQRGYLVQRVCRLRSKNPLYQSFLWQALKEPIHYYETTITGATVAHLGKKHLEEIFIQKPIKLMHSNIEEMNVMRKLKINLSEQNSKLREARDILLPRLMSGEIEV
jgi:type I restriction enzyme S subunit